MAKPRNTRPAATQKRPRKGVGADPQNRRKQIARLNAGARPKAVQRKPRILK